MLKPRLQQRVLGIVLQMVGWTSAALMFYLIRFQGLDSAAALRVTAFPEIDHAYIVRNLVLAGMLLGSAYGILDIFLDRPQLRRLPYLWLILIQTGFHLLLLTTLVAALQLRSIIHLGETFSMSHWLGRTFSVNTLVSIPRPTPGAGRPLRTSIWVRAGIQSGWQHRRSHRS